MLLHKVELRLHELLVRRKAFKYFDEASLMSHEAEIKKKNNEARTIKKKNALQNVEHEKKQKITERIARKKNLVVATNIRATIRSKKPDLKRND